MTCVYICGLHLNNDSLRVGEGDLETEMGMEREGGCQEKRSKKASAYVKKKKKKKGKNGVLIFSLSWFTMQTDPLGSFLSKLSNQIRGWKKS